MAEPRPGPAFAALLERHRDALNAHYRTARAALPRLDRVDVLGFVADTLGPIAASLPPERAGPVLEALFRVALPLLGRDLLGSGARTPHLQLGWELLLPRWPGLLAHHPRRLARAVSNALHVLGRQPGADPVRWIRLMAPLGERAGTPEELLAAGQVAAWRSGLAQYREPALALAADLPPALAGAALGLPEPLDATSRDRLLATLAADPWAGLTPSATAPDLRLFTLGAFRGLGGPFLAPPRVVRQDGDLVAEDGHAAYILRSDRFGRVLLRRGPAPEPAPASPGSWRWTGPAGTVTLQADGLVTWGRRLRARFPDLAEAGSAAWDGHTLAVGHPLSHTLFLVAPVAGTFR
jgi:hypothetical protein